jgi:hypothetical protein
MVEKYTYLALTNGTPFSNQTVNYMPWDIYINFGPGGS